MPHGACGLEEKSKLWIMISDETDGYVDRLSADS